MLDIIHKRCIKAEYGTSKNHLMNFILFISYYEYKTVLSWDLGGENNII